MTKRELLFERVNNTINNNTDAFLFTATLDPEGNLVFNAFFEHSDFDPEDPPRSLQAGQALVNSIQAAAQEMDDEEDEEGNGSVH
jgi:hypothetical protein